MRLQIESPHIELEERLMKLIHRKFEHLEKRYGRISRCDVILRKGRSDVQKKFLVEARLDVPREALFASEREGTFETALSKVIDNLEHQLRHHKEKREEQR